MPEIHYFTTIAVFGKYNSRLYLIYYIIVLQSKYSVNFQDVITYDIISETNWIRIYRFLISFIIL